ncbi:AlpA family transcriptional regulator [Achromobacter ruhlandii]|uniref:helix-turn-helix transcriptional regulator n=1 Tax=Achromobacter TaxID=222 RepID=UPI0011A02A91|nr:MULTISPECIES: AlpA family phage regulatory protein [Achromobacter]MCV6798517.1 AlpA family transcriptional regulator [Achromobacter ruhlandii]MCV6802156.1 AlpA family transcriptional regulator [Achromobacter ruhlandii]MCV6810867.1 AlpA family transcriptional regulator [Achromobacter ruhlandii]MCV6821257.1 AlpA family transcriptional regulator [Achromobacter ruhlandii]
MELRIEPVYVDLPTAASITTLAESTIQSMVTKGEFPAPRELSGRRVGYLYSEIIEWALSRPRSALLPPANTSARKPNGRRHTTMETNAA